MSLKRGYRFQGQPPESPFLVSQLNSFSSIISEVNFNLLQKLGHMKEPRRSSSKTCAPEPLWPSSSHLTLSAVWVLVLPLAIWRHTFFKMSHTRLVLQLNSVICIFIYGNPNSQGFTCVWAVWGNRVCK